MPCIGFIVFICWLVFGLYLLYRAIQVSKSISSPLNDLIDIQARLVEEYAQQLADEDIEKEKKHNEQIEKKKKEHELAQNKCPKCKSWQIINNVRPTARLPWLQSVHVCKKCKNERMVEPFHYNSYVKYSVKEHINHIITSTITQRDYPPIYYETHRAWISNNNIKKATLLHLCKKYNLDNTKNYIQTWWCMCK